MSSDLLKAPCVCGLSAQDFESRRRHVLAEIEQSEIGQSWRRHRQTQVAVVVGGAVLAIGAGVAIATDLASRQDTIHRQEATTSPLAPEPVGKAFSVAAGRGWELLAWKSSRGLCLDFATPENYSSGCGAPIERTTPPYGGLNHAAVVAVSGQTRSGLFVAGLAQPTVAKVELELANGQRVPTALQSIPRELSVDLVSFFADGVPSQGGTPFPIRAIFAYDANGQLLERNDTPSR
jgi:hypothetical protein